MHLLPAKVANPQADFIGQWRREQAIPPSLQKRRQPFVPVVIEFTQECHPFSIGRVADIVRLGALRQVHCERLRLRRTRVEVNINGLEASVRGR